MTSSRALLALAVASALLGCKAQPQADVAPNPPVRTGPAPVSAAGLDVVPLEVRTASGVHRFTVEAARSPEEQARGLMFREKVGPAEGMIFPFDPPRPASFWMKNTVIPLDLLFIRADGTIARIAVNAEPYSLDQIAVGEPVAAVLELAGGRSVELGIRAGDRVSWAERPHM